VAGDLDLAGYLSWSPLYGVISRCNYGIKYTTFMKEQNIDAGAETYKDYIGQYYGLRALMYFYAMRVWGRVPIVGEVPIESLDQDYFFGRSSVDSCKKVILSDLDNCIANINVTDKKYYFSLAAAYALKADVHMWFKEYDLALVSILKLENLKYHSWIQTRDDWKKIFTQPDISKEIIFSLFYEQLQDNGGNGIGIRIGSSSHQSQYTISADLFKELADRNTASNKDVRFSACFDTLTYATTKLYVQIQCGKYFAWDPTLARVGESRKGGFVYDPAFLCSAKSPIYRYADIELLKAEIYCHTKEYQKALDIVNLVRKRVGYLLVAKLSDFTDPDNEVLDCVMKERRLELLAEGKRWFDLQRGGDGQNVYFHKIMDPVMVTRNGTNFLGTNEGRILFPIEATAFSSNPKLRGDQNPPYSE
jgi:hypothetical protein